MIETEQGGSIAAVTGGYKAVYQSGDGVFSEVGEAEIFRRLRRV